MTPKFVLRSLSSLVLAVVTVASTAQTNAPAVPSLVKPPVMSPRVAASYGQLPLHFEPNLGQTSNQVKWVARSPEYTLFLAGHDAVLELNSITPVSKAGEAPAISESALRMNLLGAEPRQDGTGEEPLAGKANYFTRKNSADWQRNVPTYRKVRLQNVYPGIDLVY